MLSDRIKFFPVAFALGISQLVFGLYRRKTVCQPEKYSFIVGTSVILQIVTAWFFPFTGVLSIGLNWLGGRFCVLGVTGGVATGKTTLSNILKAEGFKIIDAHELSRKVLDTEPLARYLVIHLFGGPAAICKPDDGSICREKLKQIVFSDAQKLKLLNRITHFAVLLKMFKTIVQLRIFERHQHVAFVAPMLFETGLYRICGPILVVAAPDEIAASRYLRKDQHGSIEQFESLQASQWPLSKKCENADIVFDNSRTVQHLAIQTTNFLSRTFMPAITLRPEPVQ
eukprot:Platyproteum_vivax@DN4750_c0_g1_i1.p1